MTVYTVSIGTPGWLPDAKQTKQLGKALDGWDTATALGFLVATRDVDADSEDEARETGLEALADALAETEIDPWPDQDKPLSIALHADPVEPEPESDPPPAVFTHLEIRH